MKSFQEFGKPCSFFEAAGHARHRIRHVDQFLQPHASMLAPQKPSI
jgi:hypothetical protein